MTIEEIRRYPKDYLTPVQIAPLLGTSAQSIRIAAREHPELLGFEVSAIGTRTKIPKIAFLNFMEGGGKNGDKVLDS